MGLCFFSKRILDAHLFSFFRARSCCSILFSRTGATLSAVHLFKAKKKEQVLLYILFFIVSATFSSGGIFDNLFFKWW
jgi:hypothetical protein